MKLSELHVLKYVRLDGSMKSQFKTEEGYTIEARPDLGGVVVSCADRNDPAKRDYTWIPFTNCLNGVPSEIPKLAAGK